MKQIIFNCPDNKIQSFLAVLSYCEKHQKDYTFLITNKTELFLSRIKQLIPNLITSDVLDNPKNIYVIIDHAKPLTNIDNHSKNLIFPKSILNFKKQKKIDKVLFIGLITPKRFFIILRFLWKLDKRDFIKSFILLIGFNELNGSSVHIINSKRGRQADNKYWDQSYYELLSNYKYCFCPPGDFKWTYRYYESLLLDVIPVVNDINCKSLKFGAIHPLEIKNNNFSFNISKIHDVLFL